jgi:hypothetical protein
VNSSSSIKPFLDVSTLLKKFSVARLHTSTVSTEAVRPGTLSTLKVPCFATSSCLPEGLELCVHSTFILQAKGDVYGVGYPRQAAPAEKSYATNNPRTLPRNPKGLGHPCG